jgi:sulfite reductase (NADPH) flavoprotein alpha-component
MTSPVTIPAIFSKNQPCSWQSVHWGEGEPPDDAIAFFDYVKDLGEMSLRELRFAVFALGDTSYDNFCQCGRDLDRMLEERGASRLLARVDNDVDFEEALACWPEAVAVVIQDTVIV